MIIVGKTEKGNKYHILNKMTGGDNFSLCGCYMPEHKRIENVDVWELKEKDKICEKCMKSAFY